MLRMLTIMKTEDAIRQFGDSVRALAEALGITREAVYQWGETVPPLRVYQIRDLLAERQKVGADTTVPEAQDKQAA